MFRSAAIVFALIVALGLIVSPLTPTTALAQDRQANCPTIQGALDPTDVVDCLKTIHGGKYGYVAVIGGHPDEACGDYQRYWYEANHRSTQPSCAMLADALNAIEGESPVWVNCTDGQTDPIASRIAACLATYLPSKSIQLASLSDCKAVARYYNEAVRLGGYTGSPIQIACDVATRAASTPLDQLVAQDKAAVPPVAKTDDPCGNYSVEGQVNQFKACMKDVVATVSGCTNAIDVYRTRTEAAYGGVPPLTTGTLTAALRTA